MFGAIAGDIMGSAFEWNPVKTPTFALFSNASKFTDDTVLTVAVADSILNHKPYGLTLREYGLRYPMAGYGGMFINWLQSGSNEPYNSFGNGSAMRVSPVGFAFDTLEKVEEEAKLSAEVTHNHPEGIKGAQSIAAAIFMARHGDTKSTIKDYIEGKYGYNLHQTLDKIRPKYKFDETCQGSVPQAIIAFLESTNYEDAIRKAISLGGDADTLACISGGIAEAYYKTIPNKIIKGARTRLDPKLLSILDDFNDKFRPLNFQRRD